MRPARLTHDGLRSSVASGGGQDGRSTVTRAMRTGGMTRRLGGVRGGVAAIRLSFVHTLCARFVHEKKSQEQTVMNARKAICTVGALALCSAAASTVGPIGCDEKSQQSIKDSATEARNKAKEAGAAVQEQAGELADKAKTAFEDLKQQWAPQIDEMSRNIDTLKADAARFKDTQLDGYINQLSAKMTEIKGKLGEMVSGDGLTALKDNLGKWMDEAKKLYDQAAARLAELTRSAAGG
jgi:hypothetical protein